MNDEANSHYYAIVDHLTEGRMWLKKHLPEATVRNGWAIDPVRPLPVVCFFLTHSLLCCFLLFLSHQLVFFSLLLQFGHSPTMAYINRNSGLTSMLIQVGHRASHFNLLVLSIYASRMYTLSVALFLASFFVLFFRAILLCVCVCVYVVLHCASFEFVSVIMNALLTLPVFFQRTHYEVKKHLARAQNLEFMWRPLTHPTSSAHDMFTHMMPFYSYDQPHTCGPDPAVCCEFDFDRLPGRRNKSVDLLSLFLSFFIFKFLICARALSLFFLFFLRLQVSLETESCSDNYQFKCCRTR